MSKSIYDLIDKVIGKEGPLRVPAWWMRKILGTLGEGVEEAKQNAADISQSIERLTSDVDTLKDKASANGSNIASLQSSVSSLKTTVTGNTSKINTLQSDITKLNSRASTLETNVSSNKSAVGTLNSEVAYLKKEVSELGLKTDFLLNNLEPRYTTVIPLENGLVISWRQSSSMTIDKYYKIDDGEWTPMTFSTPAINIGQTIQLKGEVIKNFYGDTLSLSFSKKARVEGSIMSLRYGDRPVYSIDAIFGFQGVFSGNTNLVEVSRDFLPATKLSTECYRSMFAGCTSLVNAPALPATTLEERCYVRMFAGCTSLVNAPALPATTLEEACYRNMFDGCTSLVNAPALPATALADYCYDNMFNGCTSLVNAPELPATTLALNCYQYMFNGCTSLANAPELPATTLVGACYAGMFYACTNLNYIKMLATDITPPMCFNYWVTGVASTGTFVKNAALTSLPTGDSGIPAGWTVEDAA